MQRFFVAAALVLSVAAVPALAQTTINITMPNNTSCTYTTGPITSNATPGQLQATATSSTGTGCGGGTSTSAVSFGPASQLAASPTTISNTGGTSTLSFQVVNATSCTGSISGAAGGSFPGGTSLCNGNCTGLKSFQVSLPANSSQTTDNVYTVTASCIGSAGGNPVTSQANVTVSHGVVQSSCPTIQSSVQGATYTQLTGNFTEIINFNNQNPKVVDATSYNSIFQTTVWPGVSANNYYSLPLPTNKYISAQFTVPANYFTAANAPNPLYGYYGLNETGDQASVSLTISSTCGDFSSPSAQGSTVVAGCFGTHNLPITPSSGVLQWNRTGSCVLTSGQTYYLNIIPANVTNVLPGGAGTATPVDTSGCVSGVCSIPLGNMQGTWQGYTPH
ncbi:MAG TPA: hypothetical protein VFB32_05155 [Rudaea sp.]|nr:hypothetical protein [Rudaea sp.]